MNTCKPNKLIVILTIIILSTSLIPITIHLSYRVQIFQNLMHIPLFTVLTIVFLQLFKNRRLFGRLWFGCAVLALSLIGIIQELVQFFIPGRWPSIVDVYLNAIGIMIGICFFILVEKVKPYFIRRLVCK